MSRAKYVKEIEVVDPDSNGVVHLAVYKHENGGMFAVDSSFVEQLPGLDYDDDPNTKIVDPLSNPSEPDYVILEE